MYCIVLGCGLIGFVVYYVQRKHRNTGQMTIHYSIKQDESFSIPTDCIAKVIKRSKYMGDFTAVYHYAQRKARKTLKEAMNTFVWLETMVEDGNKLIFHPNTIAEELELTRSTVYHHLAKIQEAGLLIPDSREEFKTRGVVVWRICPFCAWYGTALALGKYVSTLPQGHIFLQYMDPKFVESVKQMMKEESFDLKGSV